MIKKLKLWYVCLLWTGFYQTAQAQQYTGTTGLLHVPSADMNIEGTASIGAHFMNKRTTPDKMLFQKKEKFNTLCHYISVTPLSWLELSYICTFLKSKKSDSERTGFFQKDRHFSAKVRLLKEDKWWPSVAVGCDDPYSSSSDGTDVTYFCNFYAVASKHLVTAGDEWGLHLAFRKYKSSAANQNRWGGVVGGITYRPRFFRSLRVIGEYNQDAVNVGADCMLWKHVLVQASLQDGKYFNGGICFQLNLLGKKY